MAGWRGAGPERRPLGRPGDRPQGFGGLAGVPTSAKSAANARRTRDGVSLAGRHGPLPGQAPLGDQAARQPQLGVGGDAPARSSGRPAPGGARAASSTAASACRSAGCAPGRSGGRRPARARPGRASPGPDHHSQSRLGGRVGRGRRLTSTRTTVPRTIGRGPCVPRPGWFWGAACSPPQARTRTGPYWPSSARCSAVGAGQVAGSSQANLAPWRRGRPAAAVGGRRGRVGVEAAVAPQAHQDGGAGVRQPQRQLERVVAGVEDEQRRRAVGRVMAQEALDLLDGDGLGVLGRVDALHVERRRPALAREAELGEPLVRPAGDDRLAGRVARRMVVVAALGAGLGVAARPDAAVDGVDRLAVGQRVARQQRRGARPRRGGRRRGRRTGCPSRGGGPGPG